MIIRRSLPQEEARLLAIWEDAVVATHDFLHTGDIEVYRPLVQQGLASLAVWVLQRQQDGEACGFVATEGTQIEMLFVASAVQGRGVGSELLDFVSRSNGGAALTVWVNEHNEPALRFYRKHGFVHALERKAVDPLGKPYPLLLLSQSASGKA